MRTKEEIQARIAHLLADKRLDRPADCLTNAPLTLVQADLKAQIAALLWVLGEPGGSIIELRQRFERPTPTPADRSWR